MGYFQSSVIKKLYYNTSQHLWPLTFKRIRDWFSCKQRCFLEKHFVFVASPSSSCIEYTEIAMPYKLIDVSMVMTASGELTTHTTVTCIFYSIDVHVWQD